MCIPVHVLFHSPSPVACWTLINTGPKGLMETDYLSLSGQAMTTMETQSTTTNGKERQLVFEDVNACCTYGVPAC